MKFLESLPPHRLLLYILLSGLLPIIYVTFWFFSEQNTVQETASLFEMVQSQSMVKERKQALNQIVIKTYVDQDHFYIDKQLETLVFLENEIVHLEKLMEGSVPVSDQLLKRYEKLTTQENQLRFIEGQVQSTPVFQEVSESLAHPVEVNVTDLHKSLSKIEGIEFGDFERDEGRPQLLITDFKIEKKKSYGSNEAYVLNMKLLKREFL
jgi:hypothetical protein